VARIGSGASITPAMALRCQPGRTAGGRGIKTDLVIACCEQGELMMLAQKARKHLIDNW